MIDFTELNTLSREFVARGYRLSPHRRLPAEAKKRVTELFKEAGVHVRGWSGLIIHISDVFSSFFWPFDAPLMEDKEMLCLSDSLICHLSPFLYS